MGFSGLWVVWSLLGAHGEKKKRKPNVFIDQVEKKAAQSSCFFSKKETLPLKWVCLALSRGKFRGQKEKMYCSIWEKLA